MVQDFEKLELSMSHLPVVSSIHYRFFHGPCKPELSSEMSQAPGSLLPAPAGDQSLFTGWLGTGSKRGVCGSTPAQLAERYPG